MLCACRARLCRAACTAAPRCLWLPLATHGCSLPPLAALAATANANANDAANANPPPAGEMGDAADAAALIGCRAA